MTEFDANVSSIVDALDVATSLDPGTREECLDAAWDRISSCGYDSETIARGYQVAADAGILSVPEAVI